MMRDCVNINGGGASNSRIPSARAEGAEVRGAATDGACALVCALVVAVALPLLVGLMCAGGVAAAMGVAAPLELFPL